MKKFSLATPPDLPRNDPQTRRYIEQIQAQFRSIVEALNSLGVEIDPLGEPVVFNSTNAPIAPGTILTFQGGTLAVADATSTSTMGWFTTGELVMPGKAFKPIRMHGSMLLRTAGASDIVAGDLLYLSETAGTVTRTAPTAPAGMQIIGFAVEAENRRAQGKVLANVMIGTYAAASVTTHDILSAQHSDTLAAAVSRGSLIYGNSTPKWAELVIGAANRLLRSDGTDVSWAQAVLTADVTGVLPIANGGTNSSSLTSGHVMFYNGTSILGEAAFSYNSTTDELSLLTSGSGAGLLLGGDAKIYRVAADVLATGAGDSLDIFGTPTETRAPLNVIQTGSLGTSANDVIRIARFQGATSNRFQQNLWIKRQTGAGTTWTTARLHDAIQIDGSFATPGTDTKTWYERDPNAGTHHWGSVATEAMKLSALIGELRLPVDGSNLLVGVTTDFTQPGDTNGVRGVFSSNELNTSVTVADFNNTDGAPSLGASVNLYKCKGTMASPADIDSDSILGTVGGFGRSGGAPLGFGHLGFRTDGATNVGRVNLAVRQDGSTLGNRFTVRGAGHVYAYNGTDPTWGVINGPGDFGVQRNLEVLGLSAGIPRCFDFSHLVGATLTTGFNLNAYGVPTDPATGYGPVMPRAGSITAISVIVNDTAHTTNGTFTVTSYVNTTAKLAVTSATITGTGAKEAYTTASRGTHTFAAGDNLSVALTKTTLSATLASAIVILEVYFDA